MALDTRITDKLVINAEGPDGTLPVTFKLGIRVAQEMKSRGTWHETKADTHDLMTGITRRELAALITDAADWLAFDGQD